MEHEFLLHVSLLVDQSGVKVVDAPALPLMIRAETAKLALELFASRVDGQILEPLNSGDAGVSASVDIDRKVYGVVVASR
jgi:hypothetical protein